ncbi:MAG: FAD-binding protein [Myxococcota bacterium]
MTTQADIAVIGGGLSGATAALRAAGMGRDVVLVRKGYGGTAVGCGAFDVLVARSEEGRPRPFDARLGSDYDPALALARLIHRRPAHPYGLFIDGDAASRKDLWKSFRARFDVAAAFLLDRLAKAGYEMSGSAETLTAHCSAQGTLRWSNLTPLSVHRGNVASWRKGRVAIVGVEGVDAFDSRFASRSLAALLSDHFGTDPAKFEACTVSLPWARPSGGFLPAEVARDLDDPERRETFVTALEGALEGSACSHAVVAPLLGLDAHAEMLSLLEKRAGVRVSEPLIPAPHAIHGLRLQKALDQSLASAGVRILQARVTGFEPAGNAVRALTGEEEAGPLRIEAKRYVLATGRFFGGGLVSEGRIRERIFDLPVFHGERAVRERSVFSLLRPRYWARQPAFEAGLRAGGDMRPVDAAGRVLFVNLYAAGSILGGFDLATDGTSQGVDVLTGLEAAAAAAGDGSALP